MSRPLRISYPGALYHTTARGNEKNLIYREKGDYRKFLKILSDLPQRFSIVIYGYVLMGNHYHLLIETHKDNITKVMHYLNTAYFGIGYTAVSQAASRLKREMEKDRGLKKMVYDIEIELLSEE